jgi:hypothetical protein
MFSQTSSIATLNTYFAKYSSHTPWCSWGFLLCFNQSTPIKDYCSTILDLGAMVWNTSFTNLLELLPPQQGIDGLLWSSTPSCEDSQVNLTWLKCLHCWYILLVYGILGYPHTWLNFGVLLSHIASLHHLTSSYFSFRWLKFNTTTLVYFFQ